MKTKEIKPFSLEFRLVDIVFALLLTVGRTIWKRVYKIKKFKVSVTSYKRLIGSKARLI